MKYLSVSLCFFLAAVLTACTGGLPSEEAGQTYTSDLVSGGGPLASGVTVNVRNPAGSVHVRWSGIEDSVRWTLTREAAGKNQQDVAALLRLVRLVQEPSTDTVRFYPLTPSAVVGYTVSAFLNLGIPFRTTCLIEGVQGTTTVSDLGADLTLRNVRRVVVKRLNASCSIASLEGGVDCEVALPPAGSCTINAVTGSIILRIPANTSADIVARTNNGTISRSYLNFTTVTHDGGLLTGRLGAGNGQIHIETGEGNIMLIGVLP